VLAGKVKIFQHHRKKNLRNTFFIMSKNCGGGGEEALNSKHLRKYWKISFTDVNQITPNFWLDR